MNVNRSNEKENIVLHLIKKARNWWYPADTIMDADYIDDPALLAKTPAQAKCQLQNRKQEALVSMWTQIKQDGVLSLH